MKEVKNAEGILHPARPVEHDREDGGVQSEQEREKGLFGKGHFLPEEIQWKVSAQGDEEAASKHGDRKIHVKETGCDDAGGDLPGNRHPSESDEPSQAQVRLIGRR